MVLVDLEEARTFAEMEQVRHDGEDDDEDDDEYGDGGECTMIVLVGRCLHCLRPCRLPSLPPARELTACHPSCATPAHLHTVSAPGRAKWYVRRDAKCAAAAACLGLTYFDSDAHGFKRAIENNDAHGIEQAVCRLAEIRDKRLLPRVLQNCDDTVVMIWCVCGACS